MLRSLAVPVSSDCTLSFQRAHQVQIETLQLQFLMEDLVKKLNHSLIASASKRRSFPNKVGTVSAWSLVVYHKKLLLARIYGRRLCNWSENVYWIQINALVSCWEQAIPRGKWLTCKYSPALTVACCRKDWKKISAESSLMLPPPPKRHSVKGLNWKNVINVYQLFIHYRMIMYKTWLMHN